MKLLTVSAFLCAMIALNRAAALGPLIKTAKNHLVIGSASCPCGWSEFNGRCFHFFPTIMTWAKAESNCLSLGGHLASIHNILEYHAIQNLIQSTTENKIKIKTWVGGSDAQEEGEWFWSDGTEFSYSNWCPGEPNNYQGQHCLQINYGTGNCWDDVSCYKYRPSVCAKEI
ncbi:type-2 ice-structuring protein-like isoform X2 [Larimichthys crocea]|uniref:type-2 ice-structuring protein-like isoform X2 n=1 Tax=Larimichthys crocea TaxID=215358 RepID=UPI000F5ED1D2|nr:type-2 ice-structuring protein-like isoform X2 [Larimichthys crocea]XP_027143463.1 type-2 ice-structuring protein-like isoform X2 [Larimichthys crocea]